MIMVNIDASVNPLREGALILKESSQFFVPGSPPGFMIWSIYKGTVECQYLLSERIFRRFVRNHECTCYLKGAQGVFTNQYIFVFYGHFLLLSMHSSQAYWCNGYTSIAKPDISPVSPTQRILFYGVKACFEDSTEDDLQV